MGKIKPEEKWWQKYRRIKSRPRRQLSLEIILRKSFKEILKEYVKNTSLASIKQIFQDDVPVKHRMLWTILLGVTFCAVGYFLKNLWLDTMSYPLIVTMDSTTYPISKIDFPAVAICNVNRISRKAVRIVAREISAFPAFRNESIEDIEWVVRQSGRLLDYDYNETMANDRLFNAVTHVMFNNRSVVDRMGQLAPSCSEMLIKCAWATSTELNCSSVFAVRRTARGHCCVFNYVLQYNSAGESKSNNTIDTVKRQMLAGYDHGLVLILDPLQDDYAYPIRFIEGFEIFLFDPTHFPDPSTGRVVHRSIRRSEIMFYELQSTKQIATQEIRKYSHSIRKCLFRDERPEHFSNMYSYSACLVQCRIQTVLTLCRCIPYFLPTDMTEARVCTFDDLQCLNKYREKLLYLFPSEATSTSGLETEFRYSLYCPECLPDCEFTRHNTKSFWATYPLAEFPDKEFHYLLTENINMTNRCVLSIYQATADGVLDRLDAVSYWFEILSNIGGFAGMLVGFSLMCIVEIVYYIFVRFVVVFWTNYKMH